MKNNQVHIFEPATVRWIIEQLEARGYEAYAVGGCVRDSLLGRKPEDWDIATSALPEQVMACFAGRRVIPTGLAHGTVGLLAGKCVYEITTYRVDGEYTDHRRPDTVGFTSKLEEDLSRRDFTVNALAYHPKTGLVDHFNGLEDLEMRRIRCVGKPQKRFEEDALRILRAARFACVLDFEIAPDTQRAMLAAKDTLGFVSVERILAELKKAILGSYVNRVFSLDANAPILLKILPDLHRAAQNKQVWASALSGVAKAPPLLPIRFAILLCRCGPSPKNSARIALAALKRLRCENKLSETTALLIRCHHIPIPAKPESVKRWLNRFGPNFLMDLLSMQAVLSQTSPVGLRYSYSGVLATLSVLESVLEEKQCWSLKQLAVNGNDLQAEGIASGEELGALLKYLLDAVIRGTVPNQRAKLIETAKSCKQ